jgi:hypothetical protein
MYFPHTQKIYIRKLLIFDHVCAGKFFKAIFGSYNWQHNLRHGRGFSGYNSGSVSRVYPFLQALLWSLHDFYLPVVKTQNIEVFSLNIVKDKILHRSEVKG